MADETSDHYDASRLGNSEQDEGDIRIKARANRSVAVPLIKQDLSDQQIVEQLKVQYPNTKISR
jgi:hypothetical protein